MSRVHASGSVIVAVVGRSGHARAIRCAAVLFFVALTAATAQLSMPLPFTPVPLTLQPMIVLLSGAVLGSRLGASSQLLYVAAGVAGLPVFAWSPMLAPGIGRLLGPTGGYLMSYPFAAFLVGALVERGLGRRYVTAVVAMVAGLSAIFLGGVLWLMLVHPPSTGISAAILAGVYPFVLADLFKVCLAAGVLPALRRLTTGSSRSGG